MGVLWSLNTNVVLVNLITCITKSLPFLGNSYFCDSVETFDDYSSDHIY